MSIRTRTPSPTRQATPTGKPFAGGFNWPTVLLWAAAISVALFAAIGIRHVDREAIAFAILFFLSGLLFRRVGRGLLGAAGLGLLALDTEFWMATATFSNLQNHEPLISVLQPLVLAVVSAVTIVASIGSLFQRGAPRPQPGMVIVVVSIAVFVLAFAGQLVLSANVQQQQATIALTIHNTAYSSMSMTASSGQVSVYITNQDLFWHTFTIDKLGVNVAVPVGGHRDISFNAPPGTYAFYCAIPGHRQAGMQGTITIR